MSRQTILLLILIIVLAVGIYVWSKAGVGRQVEVATEDTTIEEIEDRITNIRRLKTINLDTSLLNDEVFRSLEDFTKGTEVIVHPGRTNPFSPF